MRFTAFSLALFTFVPAAAWSATVNFTSIPTASSPQLVFTDFTVTGSADVQALFLNGLAIVGGFDDFVVDGAEWIQFTFTGAPAIGVSYFVPAAGNTNGNGTVGDRFLEAFDALGNSLGSVAQDSSGTFQVSTLFGNAPLSRFRLTADVDTFRVGSLTYELAQPTAIPEPSSLALAASGVLGFFLFRRRRHS